MTEARDPAAIIEDVLRSSVLPGLIERVRPMSDDELAQDILEALAANGFVVMRRDQTDE
ncbi:hypothetical protein U1769_10440 [Sphingomonas sp. ZT3P38]|uniref:hypothetical protein n=1 Tax=Parasphingomonas zepuensis TaxID=3096161 RepID=UPI002FCBFF35